MLPLLVPRMRINDRIDGHLNRQIAVRGKEAGFRLLAVKAAHAVRVEQLPHIHKDPFDRILVTQALCDR